MSKYQYQARDNQGSLVTGVLEASSTDAVATQLMQSGMMPLDIVAFQEKPDFWKPLKRQLGLGAPSIDDLILFCRQSYALSKAGVPIIRGFKLLIDSARNQIFSEALQEISDELESGRELSSSMGRHSAIFSPLYINIIRVGEASGKLDEAFFYLYRYYARDKETVKQIKAALRYPALVLCALVLAVVAVMLFVIPKFSAFYTKNDLELPLPTQIIMGMSNFASSYWLLIFSVVLITAIAFRRYIRTTAGGLWWDERRVKFPLVGGIIYRATLARFSRTLSMCLQAGVPILQAVTITARAVGNDYLSLKILNMRDSLERGDSLLRASSRQNVFTPIVLQMISVGEESGKIDEMLQEVADFYEREVDYDVANINTTIEPLLTVGMAGLVLLLMLGIFLPMWNLVDMVK